MNLSENKALLVMNIMRVAVLAALLVSGIVFSVHHHDMDGLFHNDCPVCFAWHVSASALPGYTPDPGVAGDWASLPDCPFELPRRALSSAVIKNRAPPASLS